jgi:hypothetical protein|tara:strand:- start:345 stop:554 length:210 start_codon:yes stop_codon:yes gene_type:complete
MIDTVGAAHVVSSFKRHQYIGEDIQVSHIKHVENANSKTVESIDYVTYNLHGKNEHPYKPPGTIVDIMI